MAEGKKSFTAYCNWIDTFDELTDEEAGRLIKHLFNYVNDKNPEAPDKLTKIAFMEIKNTLKRDLTKWVAKAEANRINGSKGGRPKKAKETQENQTVNLGLNNNPQKPVTVKVTVTDTVTVNDKVKVNDKVIKNIESRKAEFKNSLLPFLETYDKSLLKEFFEYWTEHGLNDKKMRFEKQKSFGISRRLSAWLKNDKKFKEKDSAKKETFSESVFGKDKHDLILAQLKQNDIDNEQKKLL